jgi:hypothetical protein
LLTAELDHYFTLTQQVAKAAAARRTQTLARDWVTAQTRSCLEKLQFAPALCSHEPAGAKVKFDPP